MATMAASNTRDVGPKDLGLRNNSATKIDLANIADVPYYVESNFASLRRILSTKPLLVERYVRAVDENGDEFQYEEVPVEEFYDDGTYLNTNRLFTSEKFISF